ncbi:undecaprenyl-diphosphate phosphatase [Echinimonas agarilytica]|uniref:Undecaprenyl-diphosphatase n=1 Tax=Echinimonas agarilytica TaxID=1215918 RepID=A0AA41W8C2_9GAMM|nr:undecaprenyl-diphosphate phosphatase [Echinimonas agarilytica]MCM2680372.1 undecaprenyl-diphosphate phosphatase [Echinimonas agarilytica]
MTTLEAIVLALIQGLTEFLPISSSAHLILPSQLFGWADQGLAFDVAVHAGSLLAVMSYFRQQIVTLTVALFGSIRGQQTAEGWLAWSIVIATIPAGIFGLMLSGVIEMHLRSSWVIAITTLFYAPVLYWADKRGRETRDEYTVTWKTALALGMAQALALIPGTSRSGITITAALLLGLTRQAAARYSFLMSIPIILLAGGNQALGLMENPEPVDWSAIAIGVAVSFVSAWVCIHYFLKLIDRIGMLPFVLYRAALGAVLITLGVMAW